MNDKNDFNIDRSYVDNLAKQSIHNYEKDQCSVKYFVDALNSNIQVKDKLYSFESKDKFSGFFEFYFFRYLLLH